MRLLPIPLSHVHETAGVWAHLLDKVSQRTGFPPAEHFAEVERGEVIPLLAWDGQKAHALAGARIEVNGRNEPVCHLVWCAGEDAEAWFDLLDEIEAWAIARGCVAMKGTVRPGWSRWMKRKGYDATHVVVEKDLRNG